MDATPQRSTTVSSPATSTKRWPVPARSWPATVAATRRFEAPVAGSTRHSKTPEEPTTSRNPPPPATPSSTRPKPAPGYYAPCCGSPASAQNPTQPKTPGTGSKDSSPPTYTDAPRETQLRLVYGTSTTTTTGRTAQRTANHQPHGSP